MLLLLLLHKKIVKIEVYTGSSKKPITLLNRQNHSLIKASRTSKTQSEPTYTTQQTKYTKILCDLNLVAFNVKFCKFVFLEMLHVSFPLYIILIILNVFNMFYI